ncbi:MAG: phosphocholine cytidylyltransferase family protein [Dehalococcoidia bacterium]|jgi:choline kinase|nr:phosphocholine cytidylyltransferase family protein [Dehalococcoidia bacterium]MDP7201873.1 phosphocholine cytidylyltransferase family protein [Dehalococcoidia bacterium]
MKGIIIAAGIGSRLMPLTENKPKCLLDVGGKTIMQRQLEALRGSGVDDIVVVRGYKSEVIDFPDIRYYENTEYQNNNILKSLFCAAGEMNDGFVFSYSDILYEQSVVEKLTRDEASISLVVDTDWQGHYQGRLLHPIQQAELVRFNGGRMVQAGKDNMSPAEAHGEFIGLAKFDRKGAETLISNYKIAVEKYGDRPFHQAATLEKAYLTDMIQELIDRDYQIGSVDIRGGWVEIDTSEDLERARGMGWA